jgi:hypothetical protein
LTLAPLGQGVNIFLFLFGQLDAVTRAVRVAVFDEFNNCHIA